jgi:hypothetical protein
VLRSPDDNETAIVRSAIDAEKKTWLLAAYTPRRVGPGAGEVHLRAPRLARPDSLLGPAGHEPRWAARLHACD